MVGVKYGVLFFKVKNRPALGTLALLFITFPAAVRAAHMLWAVIFDPLTAFPSSLRAPAIFFCLRIASWIGERPSWSSCVRRTREARWTNEGGYHNAHIKVIIVVVITTAAAAVLSHFTTKTNATTKKIKTIMRYGHLVVGVGHLLTRKGHRRHAPLQLAAPLLPAHHGLQHQRRAPPSRRRLRPPAAEGLGRLHAVTAIGITAVGITAVGITAVGITTAVTAVGTTAAAAATITAIAAVAAITAAAAARLLVVDHVFEVREGKKETVHLDWDRSIT